MIPCKQGEIVLLPFPFTDFSSFKQRPALVISSDDFNFSQSDIIVAAVTSHILPRLGKNEVLIGKNNPEKFGLPKTSLVKLDKIITIDQRLVRKIIGNLSKSEMKNILNKVREIFG